MSTPKVAIVNAQQECTKCAQHATAGGHDGCTIHQKLATPAMHTQAVMNAPCMMRMCGSLLIPQKT